MCNLVWYKRYPRDFREGTRKLTFEERGFYGDVLDLIYECGNELADDDVAVAHMLHADLRSYRRLKARMIELGKLHLADGCLRNARATALATDAATRIAKARANAKLGGSKPRKSEPKSSKFNGKAERTLKRTLKRSRARVQSTESEKKTQSHRGDLRLLTRARSQPGLSSPPRKVRLRRSSYASSNDARSPAPTRPPSAAASPRGGRPYHRARC